MVPNQVEGTGCKNGGADVEKTGIASPKAEGLLGEAVLGYVLIGSRKDGAFGSTERGAR